MKLLLMRHGEASFNAPTDAQRPLTGSGRAAVIKQSQESAVPWHEFASLWASPYRRAQETASLLLPHIAYKQHQLHLQSLECIAPLGDLNEVQNFLLEQVHEDIILVTHQPLISALIGHFCYSDQHLGDPMMPASMALLEGEVAAAGCLTLTHLFHS